MASGVGGVKAGNAFVVIGAVDETAKVLGSIGRKLQRWGSSIQRMGQGLFFNTALALTPAALGLNTFIKFDDIMLRVSGRTKATAGQLAVLRDQAMKAGRDIGYTATEMAGMMDELAQLGFNPADIEVMVKPIALLARAAGPGTENDTKQANQLIATTLHAFNLESSQAAHVADVFTAAANNGNFALTDLAEGMSKVSPMAKQFGVSLEDAVSMLSMLRDVGIEAETAGVSLRNIFLRSADVKLFTDFNDELKTMGRGTIEFFDEMGNLNDPTQLLFSIGAAMKGLGTGVKANMLDKLFGKRSVLAGMVLSTSGEKFEIFRNKLKDVDGEAQRVADIMQSGVGGAFRNLKADTENLAIKIGDALAPALIKVMKYLEDGVQKLTKWVLVNQKMVVLIAASAAGLLVLAAALVVAGISLKLFGVALTLASMALGIFGLVKVVVITVIGVFMGLMATISGLWAVLTFGFGLFASLVSTLAGFTVTFTTMFMAIVSGIAALVASFASLLFFGPPGTFLAFLALLGLIVGTLEIGFLKLVGILRSVGDLVGRFLYSAFSALGQLVNNLTTGLANLATTFVATFNTLKNALGVSLGLAAVGEFTDAWDIALMALRVSFTEVMLSVRQGWTKISNDIMDIFYGIEAFALKLRFQMDNPDASQKDTNAYFKKVDMMRRTAIGMRNGIQAGNFVADEEQLKSLRVQLGIMMDMGNMKAADKESLIDKLMGEFLKRFPDIGAGNMPMVKPEQDIKPLEGLQRGTIEAAKAAYEASIGEDAASMNRLKIKALQQVAANTGLLVENLGIA